jgi:hypothetical protein
MKKPTTHEPSTIKLGEVPIPEFAELVVGIITVAQGRSSVGIEFLLSV